jgi:DNA-binding MarR family transcriptional regulator
MPQVMWFIRRQMRRHRTHRLSVPQFRTLVLLDRYPAASLSAVADHLGSALPTASRIVAGLVTKGLVVRRACASDQRQVALELSAKGRSVLTTAQRATQESLSRELAELSDAQRSVITRAMGLLKDAFAGVPKPGDEGE